MSTPVVTERTKCSNFVDDHHCHVGLVACSPHTLEITIRCGHSSNPQLYSFEELKIIALAEMAE